jgi:excisionase family DNA binding protein
MSTTTETARVERIEWAAEQLAVSVPQAYRLAQTGRLPGAVKVGSLWRVSVPRLLEAIHGEPA